MKKFTKIILPFLFVSTVSTAVAFPLGLHFNNQSADAWKILTTRMTWHQESITKYLDSHLITGFKGEVFADSYMFINDFVGWKGKSWTRWFGNNPYNADYVSLTNDIWVDGWGINGVSFTGGIGTDSANLGLGILASKVDNKYKEKHSVYNHWEVSTSYKYSARISNWTYVGQKAVSLHKFGSHFIINDSEIDSITDLRIYK